MNCNKYEKYILALQTGQWEEYLATKRQYKRMVKYEKEKYMEQKIEMNENNCWKMWKCLKQTIGLNEKGNIIGQVKIDGIISIWRQ